MQTIHIGLATLALIAVSLVACATDAEYTAGRCAGAAGTATHSDCLKRETATIERDRAILSRGSGGGAGQC
ncbi:MAG: hypothetical protein FJX61_08380 [Alphaproteobacteria bacterium]|nr:hypothetical protein [Alphaproteobacteria bacterium]